MNPATPPTQPLVDVASTRVQTDTKAPRLNISPDRLCISHHRHNGRLNITSHPLWIGSREISSVWPDATLALVNTTPGLLDANTLLVDIILVFVDAIPAVVDAISVKGPDAI
ncbi:hypothetical protein PCANC_16290 [Puccinia coronata f. sp. avenae]|uniref:Uncharacterized protein n=1 Tax=Puccinia coronata f. sp. avenae TaxID=200324 RepID=A0A2N5UH49_9BASI|nr:hypothetical protein PCANC_16290 [Puccinia coronata f. sp. avenae]